MRKASEAVFTARQRFLVVGMQYTTECAYKINREDV